jgi:hypothetical protein
MQASELNAGLLAAAKLGRRELVGLCLEEGADVDAADEKGMTAIHLAALYGHHDIIALLLARGAAETYKIETDPEHIAETGGAVGPIILNSPLHWSVLRGHLRCVWLLLQAGYSPLDLDQCGNNALHLAAACTAASRETQLLLLRSLMYAGFDPDARNWYGQKAIDLLPSDAHEARRLLLAAQETTRCPSTGAPFGADELRYLCHSTGHVFSEEASVSVTVRAVAPSLEDALYVPIHRTGSGGDEPDVGPSTGGGQGGRMDSVARSGGEGVGAGDALPPSSSPSSAQYVLMPVRMGADVVYKVADAESALEAALNPFTAAAQAASIAAGGNGEAGGGLGTGANSSMLVGGSLAGQASSLLGPGLGGPGGGAADGGLGGKEGDGDSDGEGKEKALTLPSSARGAAAGGGKAAAGAGVAEATAPRGGPHGGLLQRGIVGAIAEEEEEEEDEDEEEESEEGSEEDEEEAEDDEEEDDDDAGSGKGRESEDEAGSEGPRDGETGSGVRKQGSRATNISSHSRGSGGGRGKQSGRGAVGAKGHPHAHAPGPHVVALDPLAVFMGSLFPELGQPLGGLAGVAGAGAATVGAGGLQAAADASSASLGAAGPAVATASLASLPHAAGGGATLAAALVGPDGKQPAEREPELYLSVEQVRALQTSAASVVSCRGDLSLLARHAAFLRRIVTAKELADCVSALSTAPGRPFPTRAAAGHLTRAIAAAYEAGVGPTLLQEARLAVAVLCAESELASATEVCAGIAVGKHSRDADIHRLQAAVTVATRLNGLVAAAQAAQAQPGFALARPSTAAVLGGGGGSAGPGGEPPGSAAGSAVGGSGASAVSGSVHASKAGTLLEAALAAGGSAATSASSVMAGPLYRSQRLRPALPVIAEGPLLAAGRSLLARLSCEVGVSDCVDAVTAARRQLDNAGECSGAGRELKWSDGRSCGSDIAYPASCSFS